MINKSIEWQQQVRFQRMRKQTFYLIDLKRNTLNVESSESTESSGGGNFEFKVSGSTANLYTVTLKVGGIGSSIIELDCDCPDMSSWAEIHNCKCKHCCFIWERVLSLKPEAIGVLKDHIDSDWATLAEMVRGACQNLSLRQELTNRAYQERYRASASISSSDKNVAANTDATSASSDPFQVDRELNGDVDCPICFEELADRNTCVQCPTCHNPIHLRCITKWLGMGKDTCVYCRSEEWRRFLTSRLKQRKGAPRKTTKDSEKSYLNLG